MTLAIAIALGLSVGLAFGYVSQRGRFCMLSAFLEVLTGRAPEMLRAYLLAVVVQMVTLTLLVHSGHLQTTVPPFFGLATAAGGLVFGLGMVLAIGCAGAVLYRAGEGKADYWLVLGAYAAGALVSYRWLAGPLRRLLGGGALAATLPALPSVARSAIAGAAALGMILWSIRGRRRSARPGWTWSRTGLLVGLVGVAAWMASSMIGRPVGLGIVRGSDGLVGALSQGDASALVWNVFLVAGMPLGSLIASRLHGTSPVRPAGAERVPRALLGGLLMGFGATLASGDNVAHGLGGLPLLATSSVTFMACAFVGTWGGFKLGWLRS